MAATTTQAGSAPRRLKTAAAFACLAAGLVAAGSASTVGAAGSQEIGKTQGTPNPSCPTPNKNDYPARKGCQVLGEVTGFQVRASGKQDLMKAPADGSIVAWSVDLAKPNKEEQNFFERKLGDRALGGSPSARLALITHANEKKFRLRAQSPRMNLKELLGRQQYFTLRNPIEVKKGWIVALTTDTWVPNFAHDLKGNDLWRASRSSKRCEAPPLSNLTEKSHPHKDVGSTRVYGCTYEDARLLYWAYFVKD